jgi:cellulose synthase/poly-beta-1,6-N-acetylglucosamine synthase-like glycosyltransferase
MIAVLFFCTAGLFIIYVLFGYPLLLAAMSRSSRRSVRKAPLEKSVSVLLPVRNGEQWIESKLESILGLDYPPELLETIVVSDGSTDATADIVRSYAARGVRLIEVLPRGKAVALTAALAEARGDILFFTDVRQRLEANSLRELVACFSDPEVGVVSGELVILEGETLEEANVGLYWKYEKWIRKGLSSLDSIHGATGCIYAMRRELAVPLPAGTLLDDVYQPLAAFFKGYRVILDESARAYDFPTSLKSEFSRKLRTQAGMFQIMGAYPALLGPGNRMWIHFVSHKLGRLLLPWALIVVFVSSLALPRPASTLAVAAQVGFYAIALMDRWMPESSRLKKISSPAQTFTVLMVAALCAPFALFTSADRVWKQTVVGKVRGSNV